MKKTIIALLLAVSWIAPHASVQTTAFYFTSSPQSWIGAGETHLCTPEDGYSFNASLNFDQGVSVTLSGPATWYLHFAAPGDALLTVGTYLNATRWPFQDATSPGLSFYGGHGVNTLTGQFTVLEVQYHPVGAAVWSFAADFVQYEDGNLNTWERGSIRYNSLVPIPEPQLIALLGVGGAILCVLRLRPAGRQGQYHLQLQRP